MLRDLATCPECGGTVRFNLDDAARGAPCGNPVAGTSPQGRGSQRAAQGIALASPPRPDPQAAGPAIKIYLLHSD